MKYFAKVFKLNIKRKTQLGRRPFEVYFCAKKFRFLLIEPFHFAMLNIQSGVMKL